MRTTTLIAAVSLGLALAACGKKQDETTTVTTNDTSVTVDNSVTATVVALPAQKFADTVASSDLFEIQSGKLAETMGATAAVKDFGKMLVTQHTQSSDALKQAAAKTSPVVALPMILPPDLKAKIDALKAAKGAEFDKLFVAQQIEGHKTALDALRAYAAGGDQASLKAFATSVVPTVEGHLSQLEAMPK